MPPRKPRRRLARSAWRRRPKRRRKRPKQAGDAVGAGGAGGAAGEEVGLEPDAHGARWRPAACGPRRRRCAGGRASRAAARRWGIAGRKLEAATAQAGAPDADGRGCRGTRCCGRTTAQARTGAAPSDRAGARRARRRCGWPRAGRGRCRSGLEWRRTAGWSAGILARDCGARRSRRSGHPGRACRRSRRRTMGWPRSPSRAPPRSGRRGGPGAGARQRARRRAARRPRRLSTRSRPGARAEAPMPNEPEHAEPVHGARDEAPMPDEPERDEAPVPNEPERDEAPAPDEPAMAAAAVADTARCGAAAARLVEPVRPQGRVGLSARRQPVGDAPGAADDLLRIAGEGDAEMAAAVLAIEVCPGRQRDAGGLEQAGAEFLRSRRSDGSTSAYR